MGKILSETSNQDQDKIQWTIIVGVISISSLLYFYLFQDVLISTYNIEVDIKWVIMIYVFAIFDVFLRGLFFGKIGSVSINTMLFIFIAKIAVISTSIDNMNVSYAVIAAWFIALVLILFCAVIYASWHNKLKKELRVHLEPTIRSKFNGNCSIVDFYCNTFPFSIWHFATKEEKEIFNSHLGCNFDICKTKKIFITSVLALITTAVLFLSGVRNVENSQASVNNAAKPSLQIQPRK